MMHNWKLLVISGTAYAEQQHLKWDEHEFASQVVSSIPYKDFRWHGMMQQYIAAGRHECLFLQFIGEPVPKALSQLPCSE